MRSWAFAVWRGSATAGNTNDLFRMKGRHVAKRIRKSRAPCGKSAPAELAHAKAPAAPVLVVGLGASAGGLKPLQAILSALPTGLGMAVVVVQHLEAGADVLLASLISDHTQYKVLEAADGVLLAVDHVYVVPAEKSLSVIDGKLSVQDVSPCQGMRMPIDHFFCTLATDQGRRAVGVILSGTGGDGTHGLAEIKSLGGVTAAQDPGTAQFAEMPRSAIEGGAADVSLAPEQIAAFLVQRADQRAALTARQEDDVALEAVLLAVRSFTGHDFHCYKHGTLERRIRRRMGLRRLDSYDDYARLLRTDTVEATALRKDLLIGVTEFFRQAEAWRDLEEKVISELVAAAKPQATLRMWVPACASGKEAYSLAILMTEAVERSGKKLGLQLFATDADATAVDVARAGRYCEEDMKGISQSRLRRFFVRKRGRYEVVKQLRELIVFAPQDLTSDPPFSKLDLVSCRNLLIYLDQSVQKKIIQLFHFALREGGCLFLGSAENINAQDNLFAPLSQKWRIYRKLGVATPVGLELPLRPVSKPAITIPAHDVPPRLTLPAITHQAIAERFGPPAAVVDRKGTLLYLYGRAEDYLQIAPGEQTGLLADAAREGLGNRLASAVLQAVSENKKVSVSARVKKDRKSVPVKISVSPMRHPHEAEGLLLVTFEQQKLPKAAPAGVEGDAPHSDLRQLEDELKITREELSSTIDQLEQSNEHLKASNEEVTSSNEELQSANEELETSKEELQSLNEELNAVNQRLQDKVAELEQTGDDVSNMQTSGDVATIFLDRELRVRRFTPAITKLLSLIEGDIGRPIADITRKFDDKTLLADAQQVLVDLVPATAEVRAEDGAWHSRRILPYRTKNDRIEGVVITFNDVTELKVLADALRCSEESVRHSEERFRLAQQAARIGSFELNVPTGVNTWTPEMEAMYGLRPGEFGQTQSSWEKLIHPEDRPAAAALVKQTFETGQPVEGEWRVVWPDGSLHWIFARFQAIKNASGKVLRLIGVNIESTDRKRAEQAVERRNALLAAINRMSDSALRTQTEEEFCGSCLEVVEGVTGSKISFIGEIGADGFLHDLAISNPGWDACKMHDQAGHRNPPGNFPIHGIYGRVLTEGKSLIVNDPASHPDRIGLPEGHPPLTAFLGVPLKRGGKLIGMIAVGNRAEGYRTDDQQALEALAPALVAALDRKRAEELVKEHAARLEIYTAELKAIEDELRVQNSRLKESEERFRLLVDGARDYAIFMLDPQGLVVSWNDGAQRINGWTAEEIVGHDLSRFFSAEAVAAGEPQAELKRAASEGSCESEGWRKRKDGSRFWASVTTAALRDEQGRIRGFSKIERDITERRRIEQALREERGNLQTIFDVANVGLLLIDEAGVVKRVNDTVSRWVGKDLSACLGSQPGDIVGCIHALADIGGCGHTSHCTACRIRQTFESALQSGRPVHNVEAPATFSIDGKEVNLWLEVSADPLVVGDQRHVILALNNITERKKAEAELLESRANLEVRVKERTADLTQAIDALKSEFAQRRRGEVALRASELRYRTLFETMDEGFCVVEMINDAQDKPVDYRFVEINPAFEKHTGFHNGLGKTMRELVPDHDAHWFEIYGKVARTGEAVRFENEAKAMGRFYDVYAFPIGEPENRRVGILFKDITDKKRSETALREANDLLEHRVAQRTAELQESESLLRAITQNSTDPIFLKDRDCRMLLANPATLAALHKRAQEVIGKTDEEFYDDPAIGRLMMANDRRVMESGQTQVMEEVVPSPTGPRTFLSAKTPYCDAEGRVIGVIGVSRDITERKRAEEILRQSEARFRSVFDNSRDVIYRLNVQTGRFEYVSPSVKTVVGFSPDEIMEMDADTAMGVVHPDDLPVMRAALASLEETGHGEVEYRQRTKSGEYRWISNNMSLTRDAAGRPLYRDGNIRDVAERKQAEEAVRQAAKELERSNEDLAQFAHVASHDLQEPLRMVTGFLKLLQERYESQLDDKAKEYIGYSVDGATRMSQLIIDLLALSRVASKGKELQPTDSGKALAIALANLRVSIQDAGATVTYDELPTIKADSTQLTQLLQNLIGNALKFRTPDRPCQVHVGVEKKDDQWVFSVRDNGIGIPKQAFDRIFVIFQRLHTRDKYAGTGIGLAICKKIVERHGGRIWVESEPGEGSTFCFTIPSRGE
jgi:two-component system CheB/CheR fusion protein